MKHYTSGKQLAKQDRGYLFPNEIHYRDGELYVADTNHHSIQIAATDDTTFGNILSTHRVGRCAATGKIWTYSFLQVDGNWWINNMNNGMRDGCIAVYNSDWVYEKTLQLPQDADPIGMERLQQDIIITDLSNNRIYRFDKTGKPLQFSLPAPLQNKLQHNQIVKAQYERWEDYAGIAFVVFLGVGFIAGLLQLKTPNRNNAPRAAIHIDLNNPNIIWIKKNKQRIRTLRLGYSFLVGLMALQLILLSSHSSTVLEIILPIVIIIGISWFFYQQFFTALGRLDETLIVKSAANKIAAGRDEQIFYSDNYILIDKIYVPFSASFSVFDTPHVVQEIMPLLKDASYVSRSTMANMIIQRQPTLVLLLPMLLVLALVVYVFAQGVNL
jgi:hypothetical protein